MEKIKPFSKTRLLKKSLDEKLLFNSESEMMTAFYMSFESNVDQYYSKHLNLESAIMVFVRFQISFPGF